MDKSDIRFVLDLSLRQISLNSIFRPVNAYQQSSKGSTQAIIRTSSEIYVQLS